MDTRPQPRADVVASALWLALGLVTLQQSWTMDRLEAQGADPWSAPGLVPGIIGGVITLLGSMLLVRAMRQRRSRAGFLDEHADATEAASGRRRLLATLVLCLLFVFGLLGHGLPFWLAAALFIAAFVLVFIWRERWAAGQLARGAATAAVYGLAMGAAIHLLFQELFLVRLP